MKRQRVLAFSLSLICVVLMSCLCAYLLGFGKHGVSRAPLPVPQASDPDTQSPIKTAQQHTKSQAADESDARTEALTIDPFTSRRDDDVLIVQSWIYRNQDIGDQHSTQNMMDCLLELVAGYPDSRWREYALEELGSICTGRGDYDGSIKYQEALIEGFPKSPDHHEHMLSLMNTLSLLGRVPEASEIARRIMHKWHGEGPALLAKRCLCFLESNKVDVLTFRTKEHWSPAEEEAWSKAKRLKFTDSEKEILHKWRLAHPTKETFFVRVQEHLNDLWNQRKGKLQKEGTLPLLRSDGLRLPGAE